MRCVCVPRRRQCSLRTRRRSPPEGRPLLHPSVLIIQVIDWLGPPTFPCLRLPLWPHLLHSPWLTGSQLPDCQSVSQLCHPGTATPASSTSTSSSSSSPIDLPSDTWVTLALIHSLTVRHIAMGEMGTTLGSQSLTSIYTCMHIQAGSVSLSSLSSRQWSRTF